MIVRTAHVYSMEVNPNHVRDVITLLGLEDLSPVGAPNSSWHQQLNPIKTRERRTVYKTAVGQLLQHMWIESVDVLYNVKCTCTQSVNVRTDDDLTDQPNSCKSSNNEVVQWRDASVADKFRTLQTLSVSSAETGYFWRSESKKRCQRNISWVSSDATSFLWIMRTVNIPKHKNPNVILSYLRTSAVISSRKG